MVRVAMNTSNFLGQTGLCKSSIAQSRMCCIALFSASGNPSVQKVPITQASALKSKKHFAKMRSLHPSDAEHKGFGHSPTSILNLDFEIRFKNRKLVPSCTACDVDVSVNYCIRNFQITSALRGYRLHSRRWPAAFSARPLLRLSLRIPLLWFQL